MIGPILWDCTEVTEGDGSYGNWDFFVSYTQADRAWAEWIAWILEEDGHRVLVQAWDFVPGSNWIQGMQAGTRDAARTIAVLSPDYLGSVFGQAEWQAAWAQDPDGAGRGLLVVRVRDCDRPGLLAGVVGVDVFGIAEAEAKARLRRMIAGALAGRAKPAVAPGFPGAGRAMPHEPRFPGALPRIFKVPARNPNFTGRGPDLEQMARDLAAGSAVTVQAVRGMGGSARRSWRSSTPTPTPLITTWCGRSPPRNQRRSRTSSRPWPPGWAWNRPPTRRFCAIRSTMRCARCGAGC